MKVVKALLIIIFFIGSTHAQTVIEIPFGSTPIVDGTLSTMEWSDSDSVIIDIPGDPITILYKHDSINLHFAFLGRLESAFRFPEILIDANNDKSPTWQSDDWWFHVSATDCESQGQHNNYDSCQLVRPNWTAVNNITAGAPITDTIEIQVPLNTINVDINTVDTIGITFETTTFSAWNYWPLNADINTPSTWGNAVFLSPYASTIEQGNLNDQITLYPNPASDHFNINFGAFSSYQITLQDVSGKLLFTKFVQGIEEKIELPIGLSKGIYLIDIFDTVNQTSSIKLIHIGGY
jgi:hypothetical protein